MGKECLNEGISACGPGKWLRGIGHAIQKHAKKNYCSTVPLFLGHGIGDFFHGPPDIYHCLNNYPGKIVYNIVLPLFIKLKSYQTPLQAYLQLMGFRPNFCNRKSHKMFLKKNGQKSS